MMNINQQMILPCVVAYYLLIKVAGNGLNNTFLHISTLREVLYIVGTISLGSYLISNRLLQSSMTMLMPKIMYGTSESIEEEKDVDDEVEQHSESEEEVEQHSESEDETEEEEEDEEEEEEEDDDDDSDYVPPKSWSKRKREASPTEALDSDNEFPCPL